LAMTFGAAAPLLVVVLAGCSGRTAGHAVQSDAPATPKSQTDTAVVPRSDADGGPTDAARPDATAVSGPMPELTRDDVCALARLVAHRRFLGKEGSALVEQGDGCAAAAMSSGKMATDVTLWSAHEPTRPASRPLARGETCGDDQILIWCDPGVAPKCTRDRRVNRHGKLLIRLNRLDPTEVDAEAEIFIPTPHPRNKRYGRYTISPCVELRVRLTKAAGTWVEKRVPGPGYWP
jgi:hypothetical protein